MCTQKSQEERKERKRMQKNTPVRKPHTNTSDLLTWSETPPPDTAETTTSSATRSGQPSDRISKVLHGGQLSEEEAQALSKSKPCSGYKMKEMTGSGIFSEKPGDSASDANAANSKTSIRVYQQALNGVSQISFSTEESISPKKPTSIPEVAKQRELSGTLQSESDPKSKKQISNAKTKELSGNDIFGPPPEIVPRKVVAARTLEPKEKESKDMGEPLPRNVRTSVKVSNPAGGQSNILFGEEPIKKTSKKIHDQKFAELSGNNIFQGDVPPGSAEKPLSRAKLREMTGSDIFADGKREIKDPARGARKPPGGESSIALV